MIWCSEKSQLQTLHSPHKAKFAWIPCRFRTKLLLWYAIFIFHKQADPVWDLWDGTQDANIPGLCSLLWFVQQHFNNRWPVRSGSLLNESQRKCLNSVFKQFYSKVRRELATWGTWKFPNETSVVKQTLSMTSVSKKKKTFSEIWKTVTSVIPFLLINHPFSTAFPFMWSRFYPPETGTWESHRMLKSLIQVKSENELAQLWKCFRVILIKMTCGFTYYLFLGCKFEGISKGLVNLHKEDVGSSRGGVYSGPQPLNASLEH